MSSIVYYISGHGYGHAVRSKQVIQSLKKACPELEIRVRTTAPKWLLDDPIFSVSHFHQAIDVGIVQTDSLQMELGQTWRACQALHCRIPQVVERELAFISQHDVRLILGDIPPLCFEIAARASIPSVAVSNFSWNWIYRAFLKIYPNFLPLIEEMETFYRKATLALALPYPGNMEVFPRRDLIPWIARTSSLTKEEARKRFGLPQSGSVVLLSFGGVGLKRLPRDRLKELSNFFFIVTGGSKKQEGNLLTLPDAQRNYEDLIRAADVIVTKPGYGIVADIIAHQVPILYTERGEFPEYPLLVQALSDLATAEFIPQKDLLSGNIAPYLTRLLDKDQNWPSVQLDGAKVATEKVLALLDHFS